MLFHSYRHVPGTFPNHPPLINTPTHVASPMTIITPPTSALRFVSSLNAHRFQDPRRLLLVRLKPMATKLEETPIKGTGEENKKGVKGEELAETIPPPPEKPEPGDCCGSGCVRCVWDVYYEELEAYNKPYKSDPKDPASNSS